MDRASSSLTWLLGQAGGGSSGFSGGGGGGGGGFSGGGGSYGGSGDGDPVVFGVVIVLFVVFIVGGWLVAKARRAQQNRERSARESQVRLAAVEAAVDDVAFDPDALQATIHERFVQIQKAWDDQDQDALAPLMGADLLQEWQRRLADFARRRWHSRAVVSGTPRVQVVSIVNRAADEDDRAVAFISCDMQIWVRTAGGQEQYLNGKTGRDVTVEQYWTMGKRDGDWILLSIEEYDEGTHNLRAPLVISPDQDHELADRARTELAVGDAALSAADAAGLVSTSLADDAYAAAMDLSLVDDRFSPAVLQIAVRRVVTAWTDAIDGPDDSLLRVADQAAVDRLLYGGDRTHAVRTVVRGATVDEVTIDALDGDATPPAMEVTVHYAGAWYREDRDTQAVREGSRDRRVRRTVRWRLVITDDQVEPWRLAEVLGDR
ncbi:MAG: TIM44-like domain-containing protein [Solirubrobacteraceae bacterium]|nr:TIM44-like domain-containing protein [Solirubrobacteraceae bacterium]